MTDPIIGLGCIFCPERNTCIDAFQAHSFECNHYNKTEAEFKEFCLRREENNEDHD